MHHIKGPSGTNFNFNSDLSDNVYITRAGMFDIVEIPGDDLKALIANWVQGERISRLESMSTDELLTGLSSGA